MTTFSITSATYKVSVKGTHGIYIMTTNFHYSDEFEFAEMMEKEFDVDRVNYENVEGGTEITFRKREGDERDIYDIIENLVTETLHYLA